MSLELKLKLPQPHNHVELEQSTIIMGLYGNFNMETDQEIFGISECL